jgi:hypothetical protein
VTAVRVRHENDIDAKYLADVPFDRLDTVIPTLTSWGIQNEQPELSGQFVYDVVGDAYFEVIIHADSKS